MRGAYFAAMRVKPAIAIAVDVIHTSDYPGSEAERFGRIELGGGPVLVRSACSNEPTVRALEAAAKELGMAVQYEIACGVTGTDADKMHLSAECGTAGPLYCRAGSELFSGPFPGIEATSSNFTIGRQGSTRRSPGGLRLCALRRRALMNYLRPPRAGPGE